MKWRINNNFIKLTFIRNVETRRMFKLIIIEAIQDEVNFRHRISLIVVFTSEHIFSIFANFYQK